MFPLVQQICDSSTYSETLGDGEDPLVLCDGAHDHGNLVLPTGLLHEPGNARDGDGRPVGP